MYSSELNCCSGTPSRRFFSFVMPFCMKAHPASNSITFRSLFIVIDPCRPPSPLPRVPDPKPYLKRLTPNKTPIQFPFANAHLLRLLLATSTHPTFPYQLNWVATVAHSTLTLPSCNLCTLFHLCQRETLPYAHQSVQLSIRTSSSPPTKDETDDNQERQSLKTTAGRLALKAICWLALRGRWWWW